MLFINTDNTRTNPNYYSNSIYNHGKGPEDKNGMHFEGAYYQKTKRKKELKIKDSVKAFLKCYIIHIIFIILLIGKSLIIGSNNSSYLL